MTASLACRRMSLSMRRPTGRGQNVGSPRRTGPGRQTSRRPTLAPPLLREELLAAYADVADELTGCLDSLEFIRQVAPRPLPIRPMLPLPRQPERGQRRGPSAPWPRWATSASSARSAAAAWASSTRPSRSRSTAAWPSRCCRLPPARTQASCSASRTRRGPPRRCDHTNIVPVYAVGDERGVHYYAMQFIRGQARPSADTDPRAAASPGRDGWRGRRWALTRQRESPTIDSGAPRRPSTAAPRRARPASARPLTRRRCRSERDLAEAAPAGRPGGRGPRARPRPGRASTATSSPAICSWTPTASSGSPTSAWPASRPTRADADRRPRGHAPLHEPRAGAGQRVMVDHRTDSIRWAPRSTSC